MRHAHFLTRFLALFLALHIAFAPGSAHALRPPQAAHAAGTEEQLHTALNGNGNGNSVNPSNVLLSRSDGEKEAIEFIHLMSSRGQPVVLALGDVDWLSILNRIYSKPLVNVLLHRIFEILAEEARIHGGISYRVGGDEFSLLLPLASGGGKRRNEKIAYDLLENVRKRIAEELKDRYLIVMTRDLEARLPKEKFHVAADSIHGSRHYFLLEVPHAGPHRKPAEFAQWVETQTEGRFKRFRLMDNHGRMGLMKRGKRHFPLTVSIGGQVVDPSQFNGRPLDLFTYRQMLFRPEDWLHKAKREQPLKKDLVILGKELLQAPRHRHTGRHLLSVRPKDLQRKPVELNHYPPSKVREGVHRDFLTGRSGILLQVVPSYQFYGKGPKRFKEINQKLGYTAGDDVIKMLVSKIEEVFDQLGKDLDLHVEVSRAPSTTDMSSATDNSAASDRIQVRLAWPSEQSSPDPTSPQGRLYWSLMVDKLHGTVALAQAKINMFLKLHSREKGLQVRLEWAGTVADLEKNADMTLEKHYGHLNRAVKILDDPSTQLPARQGVKGYLFHPASAEMKSQVDAAVTAVDDLDSDMAIQEIRALFAAGAEEMEKLKTRLGLDWVLATGARLRFRPEGLGEYIAARQDAGDLETVEEIIRRIPNPKDRLDALLRAADIRIAAGRDPSDALLRAGKSFPAYMGDVGPDYKPQPMRDETLAHYHLKIGLRWLKWGNKEEGRAYVDAARGLIGTIRFDQLARAMFYREAVEGLTSVGEYTHAAYIAEDYISIVPEKIKATAAMGLQLAKRGRPWKAYFTFRKGFRIIREEEGGDTEASLRVMIDRISEAGWFRRALRETRRFKYAEARFEAVLAVADHRQAAGLKGAPALKEAFRIVESLPEFPYFQAKSLAAIAVRQYRDGQNPAATFARAIELTSLLKEGPLANDTTVFSHIALCLAETGRLDLALELNRQAAKEGRIFFEKPKTHSFIALQLAKAGRNTEASAAFAEAIAIAGQIGTQQQPNAYQIIADHLLDAGRPQEAFQLISERNLSPSPVFRRLISEKAGSLNKAVTPGGPEMRESFAGLLEANQARALLRMGPLFEQYSDRWHHELVEWMGKGVIQPPQYNQYMARLALRLRDTGIFPDRYGSIQIKWMGYLPELGAGMPGLTPLRLVEDKAVTQYAPVRGVVPGHLEYAEKPEYPAIFGDLWIFKKGEEPKFKLNGREFLALGLTRDGSAVLYADKETGVICTMCIWVEATEKAYIHSMAGFLESRYKSKGIEGILEVLSELTEQAEVDQVMELNREWIERLPSSKKEELREKTKTLFEDRLSAGPEADFLEFLEREIQQMRKQDPDRAAAYFREPKPDEEPDFRPLGISFTYRALDEWLAPLLDVQLNPNDPYQILWEVGMKHHMNQSQTLLRPDPIIRALLSLKEGKPLDFYDQRKSHRAALRFKIAEILNEKTFRPEKAYRPTVMVQDMEIQLEPAQVGAPLEPFLREHLPAALEKGLYLGNQFVPAEVLSEFTLLPGDSYALTLEQAPTPDAGAEEFLEKAEEAWSGISMMKPYLDVKKPLLPVFHAEETLGALPLAAKAGPVVVLAASDKETEAVETLMARLSIPADQYKIRMVPAGQDVKQVLAEVREEMSHAFKVHDVDPNQLDWLSRLLKALDAQGQRPVGDLDPAIQAAQDYFTFV